VYFDSGHSEVKRRVRERLARIGQRRWPAPLTGRSSWKATPTRPGRPSST
jgi:hypothetical protein